MDFNYYENVPSYMVAVDCIIFGFESNKLQVLFQRRSIKPYDGTMTPLGDFVQECESLDEAARRVIIERTGIGDLFLEQLEAFGDINRDPGGRVISVAYYALLNKKFYNDKLLNKYHTKWLDVNELPVLHFDHMKMLRKAIVRLQDKIGYTPIALNLLSQEFTLGQMQRLYEAILGEKIDKRNFRKRLAMMPYFIKTGKVDQTYSKRGAAIYTFDHKMYQALRDYHL